MFIQQKDPASPLASASELTGDEAPRNVRMREDCSGVLYLLNRFYFYEFIIFPTREGFILD